MGTGTALRDQDLLHYRTSSKLPWATEIGTGSTWEASPQRPPRDRSTHPWKRAHWPYFPRRNPRMVGPLDILRGRVSCAHGIVGHSLTAVCAAAVVAGCGTPAPPRLPLRARPRGHAPATTTAPGTAPPALPSPAGWKNSRRRMAPDVRLPGGVDHHGPGRQKSAGGVFVDLVSDYGKSIATLRTGMVTGAQCAEKYPFSVFDSEQLPALAQVGETPRFVRGPGYPASRRGVEVFALATASPPGPNPWGTPPVRSSTSSPGRRTGPCSAASMTLSTRPRVLRRTWTPRRSTSPPASTRTLPAITSLRPAGK